VCYLYSITTNQEAIANLFRRTNRYVGNLQPIPGVFPDFPAPVRPGGENNFDFGPTIICMQQPQKKGPPG
jgi:hypothetical protein